MIFLQKSWGLPVTCCGQSVNPAATYSAFLHSSRLIFYSFGILGLIFDFCSISLLYSFLCFENDTAGILTLNVLTILIETDVFSKVKLTSKLTSHSSNSFCAF